MRNNLKKIMQVTNMNQTQLAEKTGLSRQFINKLVNEKSGINPQQSSMEAIADVTGFSVYDIFFNNDVQLVLQNINIESKEVV
ncbi:helix-turn-helix transcriptional regulator [Enterococcus pallens]|uniref:HTH cro/C1-type domain-containing protein n=1 Tax=Enterococcus pallens ATCC BAA-351 TaxID=1158607 RepID=R2RTU0_9ENTE|nr:helix-turn-helix transcriptional regulator [Enterococcus pallens]EOH86740.1 hypothetical protein UAU_05186 [Enterococcus pallens ATCC BAA-351]EOU18536.1 hypothetical protein I588_03531 [Enterococcus pallens ATCC BAA-351]